MNNTTRHHRQTILPQIGTAGQQALTNAKVLIVGMGGLGCPVLQYLSAAGVGEIGIVDSDAVSVENLHRQVLYGENDINELKVSVAAKKISQQYHDIQINSYPVFLKNENAFPIFNDYEIIIDCTDNFPTRYLISDACKILKKKMVMGAITQFEGQVAVFDNNSSISYRNLFPVAPQFGEIKNCAEAGVLGILPGFIGTIMANEIVKLIVGYGDSLTNKLLTINLLNYQQHIFEIDAQEITTNHPTNETEFLEFSYGFLCNNTIVDISWNEFEKLHVQKNILLIDVREKDEVSAFTSIHIKNIPINHIMENVASFALQDLALICQSGIRSKLAAEKLSAYFENKKTIYNILEGVNGINKNRS